MKALILFERSGTIRDAFIDRGHYALSVDLQESVGRHETFQGIPTHHTGDVFEFLENQHWKWFDQWDLAICHPPCTGLTVSGNSFYAAGKEKHHIRLESIAFVERVWKLPFKRMLLENPLGVLTTQSCLPSPQYIQPHQFGEDASKLTAFFIRGLPPVIPTKRFRGRIVTLPDGQMVERFGNQTDSGQNIEGPSEERANIRSKTFPGVAVALVDQYIAFFEKLNVNH